MNEKTLYLDLSYLCEIPDSYKFKSEDCINWTGGNTGNFAFRKGLSEMIDLQNVKISMPLQAHKDISNGWRPERVVYSAANWIGTTPMYEVQSKQRADLAELANCELSIFGLGVQAFDDTKKINLGPETIRFLRILSEKCVVISVRDQFSAEVISEHVSTEVIVTGCPSNFINLNIDLHKKIDKKFNYIKNSTEWEVLNIAVTEISHGSSHSYSVLRTIYDLIEKIEFSYICQSPELLKFLNDECEELPKFYEDIAYEKGWTKSKMKSIVKRTSCVFYSINTWLEYIRKYDFTFGMRIHGNMLSLQAGVPCLLIAHDSRTKGLAEAMSIPYVMAEEFSNIRHQKPSWYFDKVGASIVNYAKKRYECALKFQYIYEKSNIKTTQEFDNFLKFGGIK